MRVREPAADLGDEGGGEPRRHASTLGAVGAQHAVEVAAVQVLHRDVVALTDLSELVHRDDVRVVQVHADLGLVDEQRDKAGIARVLGADALDDQALLEAGDPKGAREEHLGHAAGADLLKQLVLAERGREAHGGSTSEGNTMLVV